MLGVPGIGLALRGESARVRKSIWTQENRCLIIASFPGRNCRRKRKAKYKCCRMDHNNLGQTEVHDGTVSFTELPRALHRDCGTAR